MNIKQIYTNRNRNGQNYAQPIIYEWEDIIAQELNIPMTNSSFIQKVANRLHLSSTLFHPQKETFRFILNGRDYDAFMNSKNVIPCIIDFFERKEQLQTFYDKHSKNKIVLVSSPFDYQYLKENGCPIPIGLFAYSLSDIYAIGDKKKEKKYDIVLTGRQDPLLYSFFKEYIKKHPKVTYVKRGKSLDNDNSKTMSYYLNGKDLIGSINSREDFINLQAQGKATLYGTQGYIQDSYTTNFFHMTPHFLEIIACGCHILAHYPSGSNGIDAQYYEFEKFSPSIEKYEDFEYYMDKALNTEVDLNDYSAYLKKHYTSTRIKELKEIIRNLE